MTKVRLGIVGAGIASRELHLPALRKLADLYEITAVNSRTVEKAEDFARLVGTNPRIFSSYDDMLGSGEIDAVALAVLGLAVLDAVGWIQGDDPHPENLEASGIT